MRCRASARTCATITRRAPAGRSAPRASPSTTARRGLGLVRQALRYALFGQGLLGMVAAPIRAFVRSREGLDAPDLLLGWVPMLTEPGPKGPRISRQSGMTCYAHPMRPESKGHIHIVSADPRRPPAINFNFLSSPVDAELTVRAVRIARAVMTAPAMAPLQVTEIAPGADRTTDDEILDWVKSAAETTYHPVGTCKMGTDADGRRRRPAARARHRRAARRRRLDHADADLGQHQRAVDHDRREGGGHGAEGCRRRRGPLNVTERVAALESALIRLRQQLDTVTADLKVAPGNTSLVIQRVNVMKLIMMAQSEIDQLRLDPKTE